MSEDYSKYPTLGGQYAIDLWLQGRDKWNDWVKENPKYNIDFSGVDFSQHVENSSTISFENFHFPRGRVTFFDTKFGDGDVSFFGTKFGDGDISFLGTEFGDGRVLFINTEFDNGDVYFHDVRFKGGAFFLNLEGIEKLKSFTFRYAVFDGPLGISSNEVFPCLIDLTNTKTSHHVSLSGVNCRLPREAKRESKFFPDGDWATQKIAKHKEDEERARRLKKLAEDNKDHDKAKDFFVLELQAKRKFEGFYALPCGYLLNPEFWYEKLSDYGRSIKLPIKWLFEIWLNFSIIYAVIGCNYNEFAPIKVYIYSASQMLSFIPSSRDAREMGKTLFCNNPDIDKCQIPEYIYLLTFPQNLLALILLFLLGLGMRHKFRI